MSLGTELTKIEWTRIGLGKNSMTRASNDKKVLIEQNYAILERLLLKLIHYRANMSGDSRQPFSNKFKRFSKYLCYTRKAMSPKRDLKIPVELTHRAFVASEIKNSGKLLIVVKKQLYMFVRRIAALYGGVYYHNFKHATHVALSANKLMDILMNCEYPSNEDEKKWSDLDTGKTRVKKMKKSPKRKDFSGLKMSQRRALDEFKRSTNTFGISTDPLAQFGLVFSALVHDVEHKGLPNAQLVKEEDKLAAIYQNKSVAEQHSTAIAFSILAEPCFEELRGAIYTNSRECQRFRELVVDLLFCTDISGSDRILIGKEKWDTAFSKDSTSHMESTHHRRQSEPTRKIYKGAYALQMVGSSVYNSSSNFVKPSIKNMRASVSLEQIMQLADVAHLSQDWSVFVKWNKNLYDELWAANVANRGFDPSTNWYEGQISFFDNYVIPLCTRINECGLFGVEGASFLHNAMKNKERWRIEGEKLSRYMTNNVSYVIPNIEAECDHECIPSLKSISKPLKFTRAA